MWIHSRLFRLSLSICITTYQAKLVEQHTSNHYITSTGMFMPVVLVPCLMTLSRFFWSNSRGPGGLTDSREKGLGFPNRYQYVPPAHTTNHTKKISSHIVEEDPVLQLQSTVSTAASELYCPHKAPFITPKGLQHRRDLMSRWVIKIKTRFLLLWNCTDQVS